MRSDFTTEDDSTPDPKLDALRDEISRLQADIIHTRAVIIEVLRHLDCVATQLEALMKAPDGPDQLATQ